MTYVEDISWKFYFFTKNEQKYFDDTLMSSKTYENICFHLFCFDELPNANGKFEFTTYIYWLRWNVIVQKICKQMSLLAH